MRVFLNVGMFALFAALMVSARASAAPITACFENWPPYQFQDYEGQTSGIAIELTDMALAKLGMEAKYEAIPYKRCEQNVRKGLVDMLVSSNGDTAGLAAVTPHKVVWALGFFVRETDYMRQFDDLSDFSGRTVGIVHQFDYPKEVNEFEDWYLMRSKDDQLNFRMLSVGRIDAVLTDIPWAINLPKEKTFGGRYIGPPLAVVPQPDAFRSDMADFAKKYGAAMQSLLDDGTVNDIYFKHIGLTLDDLQGKAKSAD